MIVRCTAPDAVVWEGEALSLTSENTAGVFDLYPNHARFMTLLEHVAVTLETPAHETETLTVEHGVLFFENAVATIFIHDAPAFTEESSENTSPEKKISTESEK